MFRDDDALERECIEIELDLVRLRLEVEKLRYELKKYDPNQPRVPKGQPEGGQWTKIGGGADAAVGPGGRLKDGPDGAEQAQGPSSRELKPPTPYPLREIEGINGSHTLTRHARRRPYDVLDEVRRTRRPVGLFGSEPEASRYVDAVLQRNLNDVARVARGELPERTYREYFGTVTGREGYWNERYGRASLRDTYGVTVHVRHDPDREQGFRVHTAYPYNPTTGRDREPPRGTGGRGSRR